MLTTSNTSFNPNTFDPAWYMNFGAIHHFTPEFGHLVNLMEFTGDEHAIVGNGNSIGILHIGNVLICSSSKPIHLNNVQHAPKISKQLISVTKLCADNHAFIAFHPNFFIVKDQI